MSNQYADREVFEQVLERSMSPDQLDAWFMGIPTMPTAYQKALFADGRAWLLAPSQGCLARPSYLGGPPERMQKLTVNTLVELPCLAGYTRVTTQSDGWPSWLVPVAAYAELRDQVRELGHKVL